jgi:hypothetical protein
MELLSEVVRDNARIRNSTVIERLGCRWPWLKNRF